MNENEKDVCLKIAQGVACSIEEEWSAALVVFDDLLEAGEFDCTYQQAGSLEVEKDFDVDYSIYLLFKQLRQVMDENKAAAWNRARFKLYPTGQFCVDFEWDQGLADEVEASS